jgi:hypothetical protein
MSMFLSVNCGVWKLLWAGACHVTRPHYQANRINAICLTCCAAAWRLVGVDRKALCAGYCLETMYQTNCCQSPTTFPLYAFRRPLDTIVRDGCQYLPRLGSEVSPWASLGALGCVAEPVLRSGGDVIGLDWYKLRLLPPRDGFNAALGRATLMRLRHMPICVRRRGTPSLAIVYCTRTDWRPGEK